MRDPHASGRSSLASTRAGVPGAIDGTFSRVVCGVDASEAGREAAELAGRLTAPFGELALVSVHDPRWEPRTGETLDDLIRNITIIPRGLGAGAGRISSVLVAGGPLERLLGEVVRRRATLAAVGSHGQSRAVGIALGSVATHLLHEAPCSVLVARRPGEAPWPRSIAVAVDGSPSSALAAAAARALADRLGSSLRFVVAARESFVDLDAAYSVAPELEEVPGPVVHELHLLSEEVDLLVVGSRGLRGIRVLGSISEQIAHEARCSVLVVRVGRGGRPRSSPGSPATTGRATIVPHRR